MLHEEIKNQDQEHGMHVLKLKVNHKEFDWHQQFISGKEVRTLGNIPIDDEIFLSIKRPWEDELIMDETIIDLARPEIEHFFSKETLFKVILIVKGREKPWTEKIITFEQVVTLSEGSYDNNPGKVYTVTYDRGPHQNPEGSMVKGETVFVKNKMIFNVTATDKS
jgi:hypothetical protein